MLLLHGSLHSLLIKAKMDYEDEDYDQYQQYEDEIYKDSSDRRYNRNRCFFFTIFLFFFAPRLLERSTR